MNAIPLPKLAPPGAGLPAVELFFARLIFGWKRLRGTRASFTAAFTQARDTISSLIAPLSAEAAALPVLIPRLRGMEDSSRHWSVWMTLDHLRITNLGFASVIPSLAQGRVPERVASTAAVKPSPTVDASVVAAFQQSCDLFLKNSAEVADLRTTARYTHPWFGPLDAFGWHAIGGFHMNLHRKQIERIIAGL